MCKLWDKKCNLGSKFFLNLNHIENRISGVIFYHATSNKCSLRALYEETTFFFFFYFSNVSMMENALDTK